MLERLLLATVFLSAFGLSLAHAGGGEGWPSSSRAVSSGSARRLQVQVDLFDTSSPGVGGWLNGVHVDASGQPVWQVFGAVGMFDHYAPGELGEVGWGRGVERRRHVRVGGHGYLWRGLFLGGSAELIDRRLRSLDGETEVKGWMPAVQPAVGYNLQPWGWDHGRWGLMLWVAPRLPLVREGLSVGGEAHMPSVVELSSGLNVSLTL